MKKVLLTLVSITQIAFGQIPGYSWVGANDGPGGNDFGLATTTDAQGNVYSTGGFKFQVDFDPGAGYTGILSAGLNDLYVQKLSPTGTLLWAVKIGGSGEEIGRGIAIDPNGNVLVTGNFTGTTTDFDPGAGVSNLTCNGGSDIFILKLSSSGTFLWAKSIGSTSDEMGYSICSDLNSNVAVGGYFNGAVDFDPGAGLSNLTSSVGYSDGYVVKLDANGNFIWAGQFNGTGNDYVNAIKTNTNGQIGVVGYFEGSLDIDPSATVNTVNSVGYDGFIVKLNTNGNFIWGQDLGGSGNDVYYDLQFDHLGNVLATGYFQDGDFDPGPGNSMLSAVAGNDIFVQKLDSSDNFVWAKSFGSFTNENGYGIDVDDAGNVLTTGYYTGTVDFDPGAGNTSYTALGGVDAFIQKMDINGNFLWAKSFGGAADDIPRGISIDPFGNIFVGGYYNGTVDFDPGIGTSNKTSAGGSDIFTVRFQCLATSSNTNITACNSYLSPSGTYNWTTSGIYNDTIANRGGCDSLMTIQLTILQSSASNLTESACRTYTSPSGNIWTNSGTYTDTIPNQVGCDSIISINLTVTHIDTAITNANGVFSVAQTGATYQWFDCNTLVAVSGETNQSFTPLLNGSYAVILNYNGCTDTTGCQSIFNVGLNENASTSLTLYPNPAQDHLQVTCSQIITKCQIFDITGKVISNYLHTKLKTEILDISTLKAGNYILEIQTENETIRRKFIKQ